jgi:hypothetical protein
MSLKEKLSGELVVLEEERLSEEKTKQDTELSLVYSKIKELEEKKSQLELVRNSLELKSGNGIGKGMGEYSSEVAGSIISSSKEIDGIVANYSEVLDKKGIKTRDQLLDNPDFSEEEEIIKYKKTREQGEDLKESDRLLKEKLVSLGIEFTENDFSHDFAVKKIKEKLKTPEGRVEAIENVAEKMRKFVPEIVCLKGEKLTESGDSFGPGGKIEVYIGKTIKIKDFSRLVELIPNDEIKKLESLYGTEIIQLALKKVYHDKIDSAISSYDRRNGNFQLSEERLQSISPEEYDKASKEKWDYLELQKQFNETLLKKSEELRAKGIDFNPKRIPRDLISGIFDNTYDVVSSVDDEIAARISKSLSLRPDESRFHSNFNFPSPINFTAVYDFYKTKNECVREYIDLVDKIESDDDIKSFINKFSYDERRRLTLYITSHKIEYRDDYFSRAADYIKVKEGLDSEIKELNSLGEGVKTKLDIPIDIYFKKKELIQEANIQGFHLKEWSVDTDVERTVSMLAVERKGAMEVMGELIVIEEKLPQEELVLNGRRIDVPSVIEQIEQLTTNFEKEKEIEENKLRELRSKKSKHIGNEPKFFGKKKWQQDLDDMVTEEGDLKSKIDLMEKEFNIKSQALSKKSFFYINYKPSNDYDVRSVLEAIEQQKKRGNPSEIFRDIRARLKEIINKNVPESVLRINKEYKELQGRLLEK